ncbi:hypothetical protein B0H19DRAFT_1249218 [Mycena capillaripes]|nr:hypothetical protein B0H19DRAFT_1249218 [Mycena capillaripes]
MAMLHHLPDELLELIFSFLPTRALFAVACISRRNRAITIYPFLARSGISEAQVHSGVLLLSREACAFALCLLVIVVSNLRPILKLEIIPGEIVVRSRRGLCEVLTVVPHIPEIVIRNARGMWAHPRRIAEFILTASRNPTPTVVLIQQGSLDISRPQKNPPIQWQAGFHPRIRVLSSFSLRHLFSDILVLPILLPAFIPFVVSNTVVISSWVYHHVFGPWWASVDRISEAFKAWRVSGHSMRIQSLHAGTTAQFTLVTLGGDRDGRLRIRRLPALTPADYSAILSALTLTQDVLHLRLETGCSVALGALLSCLHRNTHLQSLILDSHSISPSSLVERR